MLDFNQLRCFVAVAEELHFTRAAERLNMTQPPLSRQIKLLEHAIGAPLLLRNNRSVRLTPAGRKLLPEARTILRLVENASISTRRVSHGEAGSVSIGFTAAAGYEFLPRAIAKWQVRFPAVELQLREMVSSAQLDALGAGQLDFGLLRPPVTREGLRSRRVEAEPLVLALPEGHRLAQGGARGSGQGLAQGESVPLAALDSESVVMFAPDEARYFYDLVAHAFSRAGINPHFSQYVSQVHSVLALVRAGLGVAVVPQAAMNLRYEGIVFCSLSGIRPAQPVELHLAWKVGNDNPALAALLEEIAPLRREAKDERGAGPGD
ncbi:LysR family transcriptional regulator [Novosphingobium sp. 1949]|uniref:LysR family transcriptional regulator n=1 Tax=Novosphingobium organovorum TaxID=2930092 RepID=A0ABT0BBU4_9SPHN|nr:LysR family transcriptional regulator [Novosphingobium organovorum]MCJ2182532.1 LysR family transcriptional regulator [Novosphingobium organovorum]